MLNVVSVILHLQLRTCNLTTPDPGNAGVGRGKKLSVLHIQPWCADGLTLFILFTFENFTYGVIRHAAACPGIGPILHFR